LNNAAVLFLRKICKFPFFYLITIVEAKSVIGVFVNEIVKERPPYAITKTPGDPTPVISRRMSEDEFFFYLVDFSLEPVRLLVVFEKHCVEFSLVQIDEPVDLGAGPFD
jgi:hypothetical protein